MRRDLRAVTASRREFLSVSGAALAAAALAQRHRDAQAADDAIVLRNGTVHDGTGAEPRVSDVSIRRGRIDAIGTSLPLRGATEIDVRGLVVCPGFIDIHSHGDSSLAADPRAESVIRQGITTIAVGADGSSRASGATASGFGAMLTRLQQLRPAVNVASMIGLGTVRGAVVGNADRAATASELRTMVAMVERSLAEGACGASSGLEYTPGAFASREELIALCRPLASRGLAYATHMRNEDDRLLESIDESIAVARGARCALQISHLKTQGPRNWSRLQPAFDRIEAAEREGIDVAFDRYPYLAYATGLTNLFPVWSRDGGTAAFLARLRGGATAERIRAETLAKVALIGGWDNVMITSVSAAQDRVAEGKRLGSWAASRDIDPYLAAVALLERNSGTVGMAGFAMSEENLERILSHPRGMVCSDGGAFALDGPTRRGSPHPRGAGSFPRVLGRYVRERKALPLATAIAKMTSMPADRLRLGDRGRLAVGKAADVVVFDAARIADTATFENPFQYPVGIALVMVNGAMALRDGRRGGSAGRVLRSDPMGGR
jgi:N-acyl-D-amino-acid deacylase